MILFDYKASYRYKYSSATRTAKSPKFDSVYKVLYGIFLCDFLENKSPKGDKKHAEG